MTGAETVLQKLARIRAEKAALAGGSTPSANASTQLIPAKTIETAQLAELQTAPDEPAPTLNINPIEQIVGFDYNKFNRMLTEFKINLEAKAPGIANYLKDIHANLNQYPELCHLLNDDQLGLIVSGYFDYTNTKMAEVVVKSKKGKVSVNEAEKLFG